MAQACPAPGPRAAVPRPLPWPPHRSMASASCIRARNWLSLRISRTAPLNSRLCLCISLFRSCSSLLLPCFLPNSRLKAEAQRHAAGRSHCPRRAGPTAPTLALRGPDAGEQLHSHFDQPGGEQLERHRPALLADERLTALLLGFHVRQRGPNQLLKHVRGGRVRPAHRSPVSSSSRLCGPGDRVRDPAASRPSCCQGPAGPASHLLVRGPRRRAEVWL